MNPRLAKPSCGATLATANSVASIATGADWSLNWTAMVMQSLMPRGEI